MRAESGSRCDDSDHAFADLGTGRARLSAGFGTKLGGEQPSQIRTAMSILPGYY